MKIGVCGSLESNDCLITVRKIKGREIIVESIVYEFYGEQIKKVINDVLIDEGIEDIHVHCNDRGALDYTIAARLRIALERMNCK